MAKKPRKSLPRHLRLPLLYRIFPRIILALTAAALWNHFVNRGVLLPPSFAYAFLAVLFGVFAWMAYLRMDGLRLPKIDKKLFDWKRKPQRSYGDMSDYVDEELDHFDDLDEDEQELCLLWANGLCCVIFLVVSFL